MRTTGQLNGSELFDFLLTPFAKYVIIWTICCPVGRFREGFRQFLHHYLVKPSKILSVISVNKILVNNAVNLSMFMVSVSAKLTDTFRCQNTEYSVLDLKARYRGRSIYTKH